MAKQGRFVPITTKVNAIVLISLVVGIGAITGFFATSLFNTIDQSTSSSLQRQGEDIYEAIEKLMLPGQAPLAVDYLDALATRGDRTVNLYRPDGVRAFQDNLTIFDVNSRLGSDVFSVRGNPDTIIQRDVVGRFAEVVTPPAIETEFRELDGNVHYYRIYRPLLNLPRCSSCHGADTLRGVLDIRADITSAVNRQQTALWISGGLFLGMVVMLSGLITVYLRRAVILPVRSIGEVCTEVTDGNFDVRASVHSNDELGVLGRTVNSMVNGLYERYALSKYVSSSTLASLKSDEKGRDEHVTMFFSDIRGFTSYSDSHSAEEVVAYLNKLLNFQTELIIENGGDVDKYVGDEIVALFGGEDAELHAIRAAVAIQSALADRSDTEFSGLKVGIGINAGDVILGMIGSSQRADFTVIGDNVNLAARLCSAAGPGEIVVSEATTQGLGGRAVLDGPYRLKVKGKAEQQRVYRVTGLEAQS